MLQVSMAGKAHHLPSGAIYHLLSGAIWEAVSPVILPALVPGSLALNASNSACLYGVSP